MLLVVYWHSKESGKAECLNTGENVLKVPAHHFRADINTENSLSNRCFAFRI